MLAVPKMTKANIHTSTQILNIDIICRQERPKQIYGNNYRVRVDIKISRPYTIHLAPGIIGPLIDAWVEAMFPPRLIRWPSKLPPQTHFLQDPVRKSTQNYSQIAIVAETDQSPPKHPPRARTSHQQLTTIINTEKWSQFSLCLPPAHS